MQSCQGVMGTVGCRLATSQERRQGPAALGRERGPGKSYHDGQEYESDSVFVITS